MEEIKSKIISKDPTSFSYLKPHGPLTLKRRTEKDEVYSDIEGTLWHKIPSGNTSDRDEEGTRNPEGQMFIARFLKPIIPVCDIIRERGTDGTYEYYVAEATPEQVGEIGLDTFGALGLFLRKIMKDIDKNGNNTARSNNRFQFFDFEYAPAFLANPIIFSREDWFFQTRIQSKIKDPDVYIRWLKDITEDDFRPIGDSVNKELTLEFRNILLEFQKKCLTKEWVENITKYLVVPLYKAISFPPSAHRRCSVSAYNPANECLAEVLIQTLSKRTGDALRIVDEVLRAP